MSLNAGILDQHFAVAQDTGDGAEERPYATIKTLIWAYFWLLIFEGVLRKWLLPSLANPILLVRDVVLVGTYVFALSRGVFPTNPLTIATTMLACLSALLSITGGSGTILITIYGIRANFLHLPLIFLLPNVFTIEDVRRMGRWLLLLSFPMALLVVAQFRAGPDSWLNTGAGGGAEGQMEVALGKIRPAGFFSFNTGLFSYLGLTAAFLLDSLMRSDKKLQKLSYFALLPVGLMVALSGSRSTLSSMFILLTGVVLICVRNPQFFGRALKGFVFIGVAYLILSVWSEFRTGLLVHEDRFVTAGGLMDGLVWRVLGEFVSPFSAVARAPMAGLGLGMGTNFASTMLFGERRFLFAEGEWERVVMESGPVLGFAYIALRLAFILVCLRFAMKSLRQNDPLAVLIWLSVAPTLMNGQFGVPTTLGFAAIGGGLCVAAAGATAEEAGDERKVIPLAVANEPRRVRGRSLYAERLHAR